MNFLRKNMLLLHTGPEHTAQPHTTPSMRTLTVQQHRTKKGTSPAVAAYSYLRSISWALET